MRKMQLWLLSFVLIFALMMTGCEKSGEPVGANAVPDTRIISYSISSTVDLDKAGNPTTMYKTTIYVSGSDIDGNIKEFQYSLNPAFPRAETDTVYRSLVEVSLDFAEASTSYTLYVRAVDNLNAPDPTAASTVIKRDFGKVETSFNQGPINGSVTSTSNRWQIESIADAGQVTKVQWALDEETDWTDVTVDEFGLAICNVLNISPGAHTIFFRGVRDDGNVDETPLVISFQASEGFAPEQTITLPANGASFFVPEGGQQDLVDVNWEADLSFYYGAVDRFEYKAPGDTGFTSIPNSKFDVSASFPMENLDPGEYTVECRTVDIAGNVTEGSVTFAVKELLADNGVLFVNGIDWTTYGAEADDFWDTKMCMGDVTNYKFWDLFTYYSGYPDPINPPLGVGSIPSWMIDNTTYFTSIVWIGNSYAGDFELYDESFPALIKFLKAGGNVILATRYGASFFDEATYGDLVEYVGGIDDWTIGVSVSDATPLVATVTGLQTMIGAGASLADMPKITGNATTSRIFSWDTEWDGGFRVQPTDGGGQFIFISGRSYRIGIDGATSFSNYDYILRTWFGEE